MNRLISYPIQVTVLQTSMLKRIHRRVNITRHAPCILFIAYLQHEMAIAAPPYNSVPLKKNWIFIAHFNSLLDEPASYITNFSIWEVQNGSRRIPSSQHEYILTISQDISELLEILGDRRMDHVEHRVSQPGKFKKWKPSINIYYFHEVQQ